MPTPNPRAPYIVVDDFLPADLALAMRADIEAHFAEPGRHRAESHQVWNYWFVPEMYAYLRTTPEKVIRRELVQGFHDALRSWSIELLGLGQVSWPYLSLYVPGCRQGLHNDSANGRFGFVYSLTRNERRTSGGETIILHEGDPFRTKLTTAAAGRGLYEAVAPRFNRLVAFDDRLPHAVERIEGVMDPVEGRFVLHGHLSDGGTIVDGALPPEAILAGVSAAFGAATGPLHEAVTANAAAAYHGPLALRFTIAPTGEVASCQVLIDRVVSPLGDIAGWDRISGALQSALLASVFPTGPGPTTVTLPLLIGGKLPGIEA
jgi:Rps23 Pro-64 3,4-dihydroxylase Tpa1-like proline 4-hydroxylase